MKQSNEINGKKREREVSSDSELESERENKVARLSNNDKSDDNDSEVSLDENSQIETDKDRCIADFQSEKNIEKGKNLISPHTQSEDSGNICKYFEEEEQAQEAFVFQNNIIDYTNGVNRASIAADNFENSELENKYLDNLPDPEVLAEQGYKLLETAASNPEAVEAVKGLISIIGNI